MSHTLVTPATLWFFTLAGSAFRVGDVARILSDRFRSWLTTPISILLSRPVSPCYVSSYSSSLWCSFPLSVIVLLIAHCFAVTASGVTTCLYLGLDVCLFAPRALMSTRPCSSSLVASLVIPDVFASHRLSTRRKFPLPSPRTAQLARSTTVFASFPLETCTFDAVPALWMFD